MHQKRVRGEGGEAAKTGQNWAAKKGLQKHIGWSREDSRQSHLTKTPGPRAVYEILNKTEITLIVWTREYTGKNSGL